MKKRTVLITGGAGFIGSHVSDELLRNGYEVRVLDTLLPQVHGPHARRPAYLDSEVELLIGDVRDAGTLQEALRGVDAVFHFAAKVGVGQSMYDLVDYTSINNEGTARLLELLIRTPVECLVVASSMSIYGEGMYQDLEGRTVAGTQRSLRQLRARNWELLTAEGEALLPVPTPETKQPALASIYALSKFDQERMCLLTGQAYGIRTVALRFFNVYGTRQALSNPYTGVLAIFASRLLNDRPPTIYEDGYQQRDFVSVYDVAQACRLALETSEADGEVFNVGSGKQYTVREIANCLAEVLDKEYLEADVTNKYRVGDIRHCFADIERAQKVLGYRSRIGLKEGLAQLADWLAGQVVEDKATEASRELELRGLTV